MSDIRSPLHRHPKAGLTTGAGIAIAGIWISGSAATIMLAMIIFIWSPPTDGTPSAGAAILTLALIAAPMLAAYSATVMIAGRDS